MKVDYQILYFALIRRAILWLLVSFGFLFSLDFVVHLIIEQSTENFFQLPNLLNTFLFGCWNTFYTAFIIFQVHHLGGVPSPISTLQERCRAIVLTFIYSLFSVLLLFPFFNSSNIKTSWSTLTLPILSSTILMLRIYFTEPISFTLESTQSKTSFITQFLQTLKNTTQKIIPSILYFLGGFLTVKLVITVWELVVRDNILLKLPQLDNFHKLVQFVQTTIVTKEIVLVTLLIMVFVHLSYAVFRDLAVYVLSLPIDFLKLQPQPNLKLAKEHLLMTSISNHTQESHNSIYEGVTVSLQECYEEYQQREGSSTAAYELNSKNRGRGLKSQLFTIYQKDITTTLPVSEFICHYYQRKLQETYQAMKSNADDSEEDGGNELSFSNDAANKDKEENSSSSYFPVSSFLHPWKSESFFDLFKHGFAYVTSFQYSLYYFFRCFGWNDVNQIAKDPSLYFRRNSLYEHHWNQMMNQGFQVLLATIIQMNILSDYIQESNPLRLQYEKIEKKGNDLKNRDEDQDKSKELPNEKESIDILDQIAQLKARLQPNTSSHPLTAESIEVSFGKNYKLPAPIRFLLSFIPKQFQSKISSIIRKFIKKLNEKYQLNQLFNKILLPIFNKYIFYFPQKNEFISNQILSINSIQYFQYYFSPLYCQNLINIIESITLLYHTALNEDEKGVTLVTFPTFFLFLLQLDITLLEYLEFCQPQFLLNSPNSYSYQNGNSNNNNNNMTPQQQQLLPRRYKQRSIKQLPNHLMQLSNVVKEMIGRILVDYSDLLSISQSTVASSQRNHIFNLNIYSKEIIERIRYHEEEMRLQQEQSPQGVTAEVN